MGVTQYELGRALTDQVTAEVLDSSRLKLEELCAVNADTIDYRQTLARRMLGVSGAITNIVVSRGTIDSRNFGEPDNPDLYEINHLRSPVAGGVLSVLPDLGSGASLKLLDYEQEKTLVSAHVLPDDLAKAIIEDTVDPYDRTGIGANDRRGPLTRQLYPFDGRFDSNIASQYLGVLKELATGLLDLTIRR